MLCFWLWPASLTQSKKQCVIPVIHQTQSGSPEVSSPAGSGESRVHT